MESTIEGAEPEPEKGPKVQFARFVSGELVLFSAYTSELEYIAVSHVFIETEWHSIPGIKNEVLASPQKAVFIEKELPALVGDLPFWMDILTVNQRIQAEVISVVGAIPWIFRDAVQTLAVREEDGIYSCCEKVLEGMEGWGSLFSALKAHHIDHLDDVCDESYLQRLWTFQECLLSHCIRFVVCRRENHSKKETNARGGFRKHQADLMRLEVSLWVLGHLFSSDAGIELSIEDFKKAYVHGKTITRLKSKRRTAAEDIYTGSFVAVNLVSRRVASEPRDYIYATMRHFPWYKYPANAENMAFGELFTDLYNQAAENRHTFAPKITASMIQPSATDTSNAWLPSQQQPEPQCLGDFLKLLGQRLATGTLNNVSCFHTTTTVRVLASHEDVYLDPFPMIQSAMIFFEDTWRESHIGGELSKYGCYPKSSWEMDVTDAASLGWWPDVEKSKGPHFRLIEDGDQTFLAEGPSIEFKTLPAESPGLESTFPSSMVDHDVDYVPILEHSRSILDAAWYALSPRFPKPHYKTGFKKFQRKMKSRRSKQLLHTLALLTAMVNCRIGLSAARWVRKHFLPALIRYDKDNVVLGLLAKRACPSTKHSKLMMSVGRHLQGPSLGKDLVLVDLAAPSAPVGIIPNFHYGDETEEEGKKRMRVLYRGLGVFDDAGTFILAHVSPESYAAELRMRMEEDAVNKK